MTTASKILIVEDEAIIAMDMCNQLESFGYNVIGIAHAGGQAIELAIEHKPDLIMMDIVLKGTMDGITAATVITESMSIPVIFLTAYSDPATLLRAKEVGAYGYLTKPYRSNELRSSIEVALYKHQLENKLKESEQWFAKTLHCISDCIIATDTDGRVKFMNPVAEKVTGLQLEQAEGILINDLMTLVRESDHTQIENPVVKTLKSRTVTGPDSNVFLLTPSNKAIPIDNGAAPIIGDNGKLLGAVLVFRDITERRQIENQLRESEECFHSAFDQASIGMALLAVNGQFLQVNSALCSIFGRDEDELLTFNVKQLAYDESLLHEKMQQLLFDELPSFHVQLDCKHKIKSNTVWIHLSASLVRNANNAPQYFIFQIQDITERKNTEQKLMYVAKHDELTGLLNRAHFHDSFTLALAAALRRGTKLALLFLDLDRFKLVNDTLGHHIGDLLIKAVSDRLQTGIRANDLLARLGGDEFLLMLSDIHDIDNVARIAQSIIEKITQPFSLEGHDIVVTASIGISIFPDDGDNSDTLMMNADTAMYLAKERGKNNYQFYTIEMTKRSIERMSIERGLRQALLNNSFNLHYQPQINVMTGQADSVEALIRWQHPELGLIYPERFIEVAEETGLIVPIGLWVLRTACLQIKKWQANNEHFNRVAVNVSPRQFLEPNLFHSIKAVIEETGIDPASLELELTESAVMQDPKRTLSVLHQLHEIGVNLSIDDFGTGYSSLTYLRQFPVFGVKIDRSFISDIPSDEGSKILTRAIIAMSHELNLNVTVEGVENQEQLAFLKAHHCDTLQGYLFFKPEDAETIETDFDSDKIETLLYV